MMPAFRSTATVSLSSPAAVAERMCDHLIEHDLAATRHGATWRVRFPSGEAGIDVGTNALALTAEASDVAALCAIRLALASHLLEFAGSDRPTISWTGDAIGIAEPPNFRRMTVMRNEPLTRSMRRVTLTGADLARYDSFDLHVKLLLPAPDRRSPVWPSLGKDGLIRWPSGEDRLSVRIYTVRRIDVPRGEIDIDMVVHEHAAGPGSTLAANARPGDIVGMIGPGGRNAAPADWTLLAGDTTALPAISRILEQMAPSARGMALIEATEEEAELPLTRPAGMDVRWLLPSHVEDESASPLWKAVRDVPIAEGDSVFCWAGAEFDTVIDVRAHWRKRQDLDRRRHLAVSYWRRGVSQS